MESFQRVYIRRDFTEKFGVEMVRGNRIFVTYSPSFELRLNPPKISWPPISWWCYICWVSPRRMEVKLWFRSHPDSLSGHCGAVPSNKSSSMCMFVIVMSPFVLSQCSFAHTRALPRSWFFISNTASRRFTSCLCVFEQFFCTANIIMR